MANLSLSTARWHSRFGQALNGNSSGKTPAPTSRMLDGLARYGDENGLQLRQRRQPLRRADMGLADSAGPRAAMSAPSPGSSFEHIQRRGAAGVGPLIAPQIIVDMLARRLLGVLENPQARDRGEIGMLGQCLLQRPIERDQRRDLLRRRVGVDVVGGGDRRGEILTGKRSSDRRIRFGHGDTASQEVPRLRQPAFWKPLAVDGEDVLQIFSRPPSCPRIRRRNFATVLQIVQDMKRQAARDRRAQRRRHPPRRIADSRRHIRPPSAALDRRAHRTAYIEALCRVVAVGGGIEHGRAHLDEERQLHRIAGAVNVHGQLRPIMARALPMTAPGKARS